MSTPTTLAVEELIRAAHTAREAVKRATDQREHNDESYVAGFVQGVETIALELEHRATQLDQEADEAGRQTATMHVPELGPGFIEIRSTGEIYYSAAWLDNPPPSGFKLIPGGLQRKKRPADE